MYCKYANGVIAYRRIGKRKYEKEPVLWCEKHKKSVLCTEQHVLFRNVFHPKNESMLTVSYYQHIMSVWRDRNMDLKHNQITMRELLKNKQAYSLLYQEFPMFMTPAILQNIRPLTLQQIIQMVRPYISRPKLNMLLEQLENI